MHAICMPANDIRRKDLVVQQRLMTSKSHSTASLVGIILIISLFTELGLIINALFKIG